MRARAQQHLNAASICQTKSPPCHQDLFRRGELFITSGTCWPDSRVSSPVVNPPSVGNIDKMVLKMTLVDPRLLQRPSGTAPDTARTIKCVRTGTAVAPLDSFGFPRREPRWKLEAVLKKILKETGHSGMQGCTTTHSKELLISVNISSTLRLWWRRVVLSDIRRIVIDITLVQCG